MDTNSERYSITYLEMQRKHPTWTMGNIHAVAQIEDEWGSVRTEVLLEAPCFKCKREMGTHNWDGKVFICP